MLVHDKNLEDWGQDHYRGRVFVTRDAAEFLRWVAESRTCAVFIDEARHVCGRDSDDRFINLATEGRHRGHAMHFCTQQITSIHHEIRANCARTFVFNLRANEAKKTAQHLGRPEIERLATSLPQGEFLLDHPMQPLRRMRVGG